MSEETFNVLVLATVAAGSLGIAFAFSGSPPAPAPVVGKWDIVDAAGNVRGLDAATRQRVGVVGEVIQDGPYRTAVVYATATSTEWRYAVVPRPCDLDRNGWVNGDDADLFNAWFDAGDQRADFDGNGWVNGDDADAFAEAFEHPSR